MKVIANASFFHQRESNADVLRVIAIFGVFVVNGLGYLTAPSYPIPLGAPAPPDSPLALGIYGVLFFLFQGKAWPLLCLLFGYSLQSMATQLSQNNASAQQALQSRYKKLLLIGVVHGLLIYFGDVLTIYAISGLIALRWATSTGVERTKSSQLLRIWKWWLAASVLMLILAVWPSLSAKQEESFLLPSYSSIHSWHEFFALTAEYYIYVLIASATIFLPLYVWLTLSGMLVCRLRLLSHRSFAIKFWQARLSRLQLVLSSTLCSFWAIYALLLMKSSADYTQLGLVAVLSIPAGIWWLACCLACFMRRTTHGMPQALLWLAPAARYTLTMYLGLSVFLMIGVSPVLGGRLAFLFSTTASTILTLFVVWLLAVWLARAAAQRELKDPLSKWLRKSHSAAEIKG